MSKIILLNGCGSSGKTSIAKAIQDISPEPWLHIGIDSIIALMPYRFNGFGDKTDVGYYKFISGENCYGKTIDIECFEKGAKMFDMLPKISKQLADLGENIIIDEVMVGKASKNIYFETLVPHKIYFVGVYCDLDILNQREYNRGDRCIGLANAQFDVVHRDYENLYDLKIDTTKTSSIDLAQKILNFIN